MTYLAADGDDGYGVGVGTPGSFANVVNVGATTLIAGGKSQRGFVEAAWPGTNSGCSHEPKPSWRYDPGCTYRTANDVAAVGDPNTGPAFYDTFGYAGWLIGGGTSTSTPFVAGIFGLAGNAASQNGGKTFWEKRHQGSAGSVPYCRKGRTVRASRHIYVRKARASIAIMAGRPVGNAKWNRSLLTNDPRMIDRRRFLLAAGASAVAPALLGASPEVEVPVRSVARALVFSGGGARGAPRPAS